MPDDGAVSASRATAVAAGTDPDTFDFTPLMAEGERLIWQGRSRPLRHELLRGSLNNLFWKTLLFISLWTVINVIWTATDLAEGRGDFAAAGMLLLALGFLMIWITQRNMRMRDKLRYAVTNRQLLVGMVGRDDIYAQLPFKMVKHMTVLMEANGSGCILFHKEDEVRWGIPPSVGEMESTILSEDPTNVASTVPRFSMIDDVWAVHDLIELERARALAS